MTKFMINNNRDAWKSDVNLLNRLLHGRWALAVFTHELWRVRKRTSERSERVSFLIQKQRVRKYRTKHFPCCNLFISYLLRFSTPTRFPPFIRQNKYQVLFLFRLSASTLSLLQILVEIFFVMFTSLHLRLIFFPCLALLSCFLQASRHCLAC